MTSSVSIFDSICILYQELKQKMLQMVQNKLRSKNLSKFHPNKGSHSYM